MHESETPFMEFVETKPYWADVSALKEAFVKALEYKRRNRDFSSKRVLQAYYPYFLRVLIDKNSSCVERRLIEGFERDPFFEKLLVCNWELANTIARAVHNNLVQDIQNSSYNGLLDKEHALKQLSIYKLQLEEVRDRLFEPYKWQSNECARN